MIRHLVLLQPKTEATDAAMMEALEHVRMLKRSIREISEVQIGRNQSPRHQGYTYCFAMRFFNQSDLEVYMSHPAHQEVSEELQWLCQHIIDCDLLEVSPSVARPKLKDVSSPDEWRRKAGEERLRILLMDQLDVPEEMLVPNASFVEDLNADSLDLVEIIMSIEEEFRVKISDDDAMNITTVGEALEYLRDHTAL